MKCGSLDSMYLIMTWKVLSFLSRWRWCWPLLSRCVRRKSKRLRLSPSLSVSWTSWPSVGCCEADLSVIPQHHSTPQHQHRARQTGPCLLHTLQGALLQRCRSCWYKQGRECGTELKHEGTLCLKYTMPWIKKQEAPSNLQIVPPVSQVPG